MEGNIVSGPAVDTTRKIEKLAGAGRIIVSAAVRDLVAGSGISFQPEGSLEVANSTELLLLLVNVSQ